VDDISAAGFRVILLKERKKFAQLGDRVEINFDFLTLEDKENEEITIQGVVRNITKEGKTCIALGIQAEDDEQRIEKLEQTWLALIFENLD